MAVLILALLEEHRNSDQVRTCLEDCGYKVFVVDNFVNAIAVLNTQKIDLIVSDVHLENGGNVFDFLRRVKSGQRTSAIPFVLFSCQPTHMAKYLADGVRTASRYLGAVKYIEMETFDAAEFRMHINSLMPPEKQSIDKDSQLARGIGE
jgi:CheY-like chemotaxis protein